MLDRELPVISQGRSHKLSPENKDSCKGHSACCDAENTLARLYGDQEKARERCLQICAQVKKLDEEDLSPEIKVFKAVADITRLRILKLLNEGELCVCEIMLALKKPQSSISHNLSILEDAGLIKERKDGKWCHYRLSDGAVIEMLNLAKLLKK
ncbi:MAG TPA: metalloregulator ArsR/SmtB family transcription factor [Methanotrichaceae archaeon]|nr:metalloregulator ArsR/SmtB family transcription factor [Methanotrichaceae archaeon]